MKKLTLAARGSQLSRAQVTQVGALLAEIGVKSEFVPVKTKGDKDRARPLQEIGGDGLFVREVERALLSGEADVAVHCGKDLPYRLADGLVIAGIPAAASAGDCLIWQAGRGEDTLRIIGTGSARRVQELQALLPDAVCAPIRGNINTRLDKLRSGQYDAIVLAKAGLERLQPSLDGFCVRELRPDEMIPAACQGILALQCRGDDAETISILQKLTDPAAAKRFYAERTLFCRMEADCATALGVHAEIEGAGEDGSHERPEPITIRAMFGEKKCCVRGTTDRLDDLCTDIVNSIGRKPKA